jgi:HK97 family phage portal protein
MSLLNRILGRVRELRSASLKSFDYWNNKFVRLEGFGHVSPDAASGHAVALRCIQTIGENLSMVPCRLYRRAEKGGRTPASDHPLYDVLHDQFHEGLTAFDGREFLIASVLIHGNGYARIERNAAGQVTALYPYPAGSVSYERRPSGRIRYTAHRPEGGTDILLDGEMLHLRYRRAADGIAGLSPITMARATFAMALAQQTTAEAQAVNAFRPAGMLVFPQAVAPAALEASKTRFKDLVLGAAKANEIVVMDGGLEWKPFTLPAKDMEFLESRKLSNLDIARIFGCPPTAVGIPDNATYSNVEQESRALVVRCLAPMARRIEQELMLDLLSSEGRRALFIEHDLQGLLRGDQTARYQAYQIGRQNGWLSANEIRAWENMDEIDGGDEYLSPLNMRPANTPPPREPAFA